MAELHSSPPLESALIPIGESRPEVHVNAERWDQTKSKNGKQATAAKEPIAPSIRTVLEEVFELLEDYAPLWYTEEHHDRILAALGSRNE
ncbi:MAG TPA: hypothetical protein VGG62_03630 [Terracidiphilus sp.]|jgi:hypothetical protein